MYSKSETISALASSLAAAQAEMKNPPFDAKNPHFKNSYASLASVRDAITPALSKHGIAVLQLLSSTDRGVACDTVLTHKSGEWIACRLELPVQKQDAQGYGSAATYCRRYSLQAIVNVVGDEDDDGNAAAKAKLAEPSKITPTAGVWEGLDMEEQAFLMSIAEEVLTLLDAGKTAEAIEYIENQKLEADEKVALWTRFTSAQRSAMKKATQKAA